MTKVGRATLALAAAAAVAVAVATGGAAAPQKTAHDRLGIRRRREHGGVRRSGARHGEGAGREINKSGDDEGQAHHLQHAGQQAGDREGVCRASCSRRERT